MRLLLLLTAILLTACGGPPDVYAPPIARKPMDVYGADLMGSFTPFGTANSAMHIVGGVDTTIMSGAWRWAFPHAELRFYLPGAKGWNARMEFAIAKTILDKTGPQTLTLFVNNNQVDQLRYERDGNYIWDRPIPENLLVPAGMNYLRIEVDKTAPDETHRQLGFILTRAGFTHPDQKPPAAK